MAFEIPLPDLFQIFSLLRFEMIAAVFAQNGVLLDDDILGTRKISFQPFYSMKRREIRL